MYFNIDGIFLLYHIRMVLLNCRHPIKTGNLYIFNDVL